MKKLLTFAMAAVLCLGMGARPAAEADDNGRPKKECPCKDCKCERCDGRCNGCCADCRPCDRKDCPYDEECRPCHRRGHNRNDDCRSCNRRCDRQHRGHHRGCCR